MMTNNSFTPAMSAWCSTWTPDQAWRFVEDYKQYCYQNHTEETEIPEVIVKVFSNDAEYQCAWEERRSGDNSWRSLFSLSEPLSLKEKWKAYQLKNKGY